MVIGKKDDALVSKMANIVNSLGPITGAFDSYLILRSLKTLAVRMERHCENALAIAKHFESHKEISEVIYPGLSNHPQHDLAANQMKGFGGIISMNIKGGLEKSKSFLEKTRIFALAESLGVVERLIEHPALMTHASLPKDRRESIGISDGLVRLSVGLESLDDLIEDIEQALNKIRLGFGVKEMHYFLVLMLFSLNLLAVDKPNVVIILTDDLGWGDVSYHGGYIPTPNIDQLAEDGMELNRFYSNPVCSPTRASLLTGLHIFNHGVVRPFMNPAAEQTGMPPELKIMPQYFNEAGYQTALSGKWHLGTAKEEFWPTNRGFETSYGHMTGGIGYFDHTAAGRLDWHRNESTLREEGYSTELIANEAINIIKNKEQNRPLFLYVALMLLIHQ